MPSDNRERSFENALAAHLRAGAKGIPHADCSDAETLAAYHEGSLPAEQVASLKTHITGCERCQEILATLEATDQIAAPAVNITLQPASAAKPAVHVLPTRKRALWQWVAPAGALAAALLVWVAVHENTTSIIPVKAPSAKQDAGDARQAETVNPIPPASPTLPSPPGDSATSNEASPDLHQTLPAAPPPKITGLLKQRSQALSKQKDSPTAAKKSAVPAGVDLFADSSASPDDSLHRKESSALTVEAQNQTIMIEPDKAKLEDKIVNGRRDAAPPPKPPEPAPNTGANATLSPSAPPPSPAPLVSAQSVEVATESAQQQELGGMSRFKQNELRLARSIAAVNISSPDGKVAWRVGQAGIIEFSPDAGKSWTVQPSGVIRDLLGGSAPSDQVCWIVGRAGTLLRTTDGGAHWQKLRPPSQEDLHSVVALDARQATATSVNAKYQTTDGGVTWKKLPSE